MSAGTARRRVLAGCGWCSSGGLAAVLAAAGCTPHDPPPPPAAWLGTSPQRGHRLRHGSALLAPAVQRRARVLVVGGGIAGLGTARAFTRQGVADVAVLELEDSAGGNSRGHVVAGLPCPLGAHYLPLPMPEAHEVSDWLHETGLLRQHAGRTVADERHLCPRPQKRLFIDGAWAEGLLPPADPSSATAAQYRRFARAVRSAQGSGARRFALPAHRAACSAEAAELDRQTFAHWLTAQGLDDVRLRWYLDYCCRDDYGAGADTVSAWAGVHYFASRHGFSAPGDERADLEAVFTWPEGNAWLVQRLAAPLAGRVHTGRTVLRVVESRHGVQVLAWDEAAQQAEAWTAATVVMAVPLFVAARVLETPPDALRQAAGLLQHAPWLVANVHIDAPLLDRPDAPPAWDSVPYGGRGLGYVDALHQSLEQRSGVTVLTAYPALPVAEHAALLAGDPAPWRQRVLQELALMHPDPHRRAQHVSLPA